MRHWQYILLIATLGLAVLAGSVSAQTNDAEFPPLFPFVISFDAPDNITNISKLIDAPAGKNGFVRVKDGKFVNDK